MAENRDDLMGGSSTFSGTFQLLMKKEHFLGEIAPFFKYLIS